MYDTFQKVNNKGADQTARMRRLVCTLVVRTSPKTGFLATWPICFDALHLSQKIFIGMIPHFPGLNQF